MQNQPAEKSRSEEFRRIYKSGGSPYPDGNASRCPRLLLIRIAARSWVRRWRLCARAASLPTCTLPQVAWRKPKTPAGRLPSRQRAAIRSDVPDRTQLPNRWPVRWQPYGRPLSIPARGGVRSCCAQRLANTQFTGASRRHPEPFGDPLALKNAFMGLARHPSYLTNPTSDCI
jgi:hypothetical protein